MDLLDELKSLIKRHVGGRLGQLLSDPLFLLGAAGVVVLLIVLLVLAL